jgi:hypothetical protein
MEYKGSLDDVPEGEKIPWLCDECAEAGFRVVGFVVQVKKCKKCGEDKCPHCFAMDGQVCYQCAVS